MVAPAHPQTAPPYRDLVCAARRLAAQQATLMQNYLQPLLLFTPFWRSRTVHAAADTMPKLLLNMIFELRTSPGSPPGPPMPVA
ncbi:hypothetical protein PC119_g22769 [Phytophthora cactorum]|nr:hypothetical protein PC119_g22769 [Phytophthora cactorum]